MANIKQKLGSAKTKLKKAAVVGGIAAASLMSIKGKAEPPVELSVNVDLLKSEIVSLTRDSTNIATLNIIVTMIERANQSNENAVEFFSEFDKLAQSGAITVNDNYTENDVNNLNSTLVAFADSYNLLAGAIGDLSHSTISTMVPAYSSLEYISNALREKRMLLRLAEEQNSK